MPQTGCGLWPPSWLLVRVALPLPDADRGLVPMKTSPLSARTTLDRRLDVIRPSLAARHAAGPRKFAPPARVRVAAPDWSRANRTPARRRAPSAQGIARADPEGIEVLGRASAGAGQRSGRRRLARSATPPTPPPCARRSRR